MRKALLSLAMTICCLASAQLIERNPAADPFGSPMSLAPVARALAHNQLYMGPYAGDNIANSGLGMPSSPGIVKNGVVLPLSLVERFAGGEVVAIRFGLCSAVTNAAVFIYPITNLSPLTLGAPLVEQNVGMAREGWNIIELNNPATLSTTGIVGLLLGYQNSQKNSQIDGAYTPDCFPISMVNEGELLQTYSYSSQSWQDFGLSNYGNLSVQAIVEKDFPEYDLVISDLTCDNFAQNNAGINYSVRLANFGLSTLTNYKIDVLLDGQLKKQINSPNALTQAGVTYCDKLEFSQLSSGKHTLTLRVVEADGQTVANGSTMSAQFTSYAQSFARQKQLFEHFTSQANRYAPLGESVLNALNEMHGDDLAWVSLHNNLNGIDEFTIAKGSVLANYLGFNSLPCVSFNRYAAEGKMIVALDYPSDYTQQVAAKFNSIYLEGNSTPVLAHIALRASYNEATSKVDIKVSGQATSDFGTVMGNEVGITVYLTEDSLVARQRDNGTWVTDYVHNHVLREIPSAYNGDAIKWTNGNKFENTYSVTLNSAWDPEKMHIIAAIHRKGSGNNKEIINCEQIGLTNQVIDKPGDVDGNGVVDVADINIIINVMLGKGSNPQADVTGDGKIDVADINMTVNAMLGKG